MQRRGYPAAAVDEDVALRGVYRHNRGAAQQAAEFRLRWQNVVVNLAICGNYYLIFLYFVAIAT